jgi:hypothetical protein
MTRYVADADSSTKEILRNGLSWGDKIEKLDCQNQFMKNFTSWIFNFKKDYKLGKIINSKWCSHYCALISKLIKEKIDDIDYFTTHVKYSILHTLYAWNWSF